MRYLKQRLQAPPHSLSPVLTRFLALFFDPFSPLSWSLEQAIVIDGHSPSFFSCNPGMQQHELFFLLLLNSTLL